MDAMHMRHSPEQWRLFIDASKTSLKAVLLHNGNKLPSIPVAYVSSTKETYTTMNNILVEADYKKHQWKVCGDFKVIAVLLEPQGDYTKYSCFLCEWDSRARGTDYARKHWPHRQSLTPGKKNVTHKPLIKPSKVLPPPLHIKLEFMKNFVKALDVKGPAFTYLCGKFPRLTFEKVKAGVFIGPQIRQLLKDKQCESLLSDKEKTAWQSLKRFRMVFWEISNLQISDNCTRSVGFVWIAGVQYVSTYALFIFTPRFLSIKLWWRERRT